LHPGFGVNIKGIFANVWPIVPAMGASGLCAYRLIELSDISLASAAAGLSAARSSLQKALNLIIECA
jgi:hypothetical protein